MAVLLWPLAAGAWGSGALHKLGVYRVYDYGQEAYRQLDGGICSAVGGALPWKPDLPGYPYYPWEQDPYTAFWSAMVVNCNYYGCANNQSFRYADSQVTHASIVGPTGWQKFNMVFFLGHNNTIANDDGPDYFLRIYSNCANDGGWKHRWYHRNSGAPARWGTTDQVGGYDYAYCYHKDGWITDTLTNPAAVVYLYNPYTSLLIGRNDFRKNQASVEYKATWNGSVQTYDPQGGLGRDNNDNLKWLVLHGCHSVVVADASGQNYDPQGVQAYGAAWNKLHMVLGHNTDVALGSTGDLDVFAAWLQVGVPVRTAYFFMDYYYSGSGQASAISGEDETSRQCGWEYIWGFPFWVCSVFPDDTVMLKDDWITPEANRTPTWFYTQHVIDIT